MFPFLKCFLEYIPENVLRIKRVPRLNKFENIGFYRGEVDFSTTEPFRGFFNVVSIVTVQKQVYSEQWVSKACSGFSSLSTSGISVL